MNLYYNRAGQPISDPTPDVIKDLFSDEARRVAETTVGDYWISTVHLVIDHNHSSSGPPLIFETMVFKGGSMADEFCERYSTEAEAQAGHDNIVGMVRALEDVDPS